MSFRRKQDGVPSKLAVEYMAVAKAVKKHPELNRVEVASLLNMDPARLSTVIHHRDPKHRSFEGMRQDSILNLIAKNKKLRRKIADLKA